MKKIVQFISLAAFFVTLTVSCGKDSPLESGDFAEASFSLSVAFPETKTGIPVSNMAHDKITIYYGDANRLSFQQGNISGDSLVFNYPILLKVGNPGRLRAVYADDRFDSALIPESETLIDSLFVDSEDPSTIHLLYDNDKYHITLNFKHLNALADFIVTDNSGADITQQVDKVFTFTCQNNGEEKMYADAGSKIILPAGCTLKYAVVYLKNGKEIKVKNPYSDIHFERNKRYPLQITLDSERMSMLSEEGIENWSLD